MASSMPPPAPVRQLPVLETVRSVYRFVFGNLPWLIQAAVVPYVMSVLLLILQLTLAPEIGIYLLLHLAGFVPYTLFAVSWHRLALLGPAAASPPWLPPWHLRHWRFFGYFLLVNIIGNIVVVPLIALLGGMLVTGATSEPSLGFFLVLPASVLVMLYVMLRLGFVLPAVAVDERYGLAESWRHTAGQGFRLVGAMVFAVAPLALPLVLLFLIAGAEAPPDEAAGPETQQQVSLGATIAIQVIVTALIYLLTAITVSVISVAFRACTGWIPGPAGGPPARSGGT